MIFGHIVLRMFLRNVTIVTGSKETFCSNDHPVLYVPVAPAGILLPWRLQSNRRSLIPVCSQTLGNRAQARHQKCRDEILLYNLLSQRNLMNYMFSLINKIKNSNIYLLICSCNKYFSLHNFIYIRSSLFHIII